MKNNYKRTKTTVSLIHYHFVFCPRYRRKIFNIPGLEERFKDLTKASCTALNIDILAMECHIDHVHLFLSCPPTMSPSDIMHQIKGASSFVLREEFRELAKMPSLWTRSFFVSTAGMVSSETIRHYVDTQKTRYWYACLSRLQIQNLSRKGSNTKDWVIFRRFTLRIQPLS